MPAFVRAILIQESAEGGLSYKVKNNVETLVFLGKIITTGLAGGLHCPYKGLIPACARKAH